MKNTKKGTGALLCSALLFILFIIFTLTVMSVDKAPIGPLGSEVGLSSLNGPVAELLPFNETCYDLSEVLGFLGIVTALCFGAYGLFELIRNRSLLKIDRSVILLGILYVLVAAAYVGFEVVVINFRPVLTEGVLEASYPSSHTLLACCIFGSAPIAIGSIASGKPALVTYSRIIYPALAAATVICRLLSGCHWVTDIIGGLLLSAALVTLYLGMLRLFTARGILAGHKDEQN